MSTAENTEKYLSRKTKNLWSWLKLKIKKQLGWIGAPQLIPYRGYANAKTIYLTGYLTEDKGLEKPDTKQSTWQNAVSMLKRYASDNLPEVNLKVSVGNQQTETRTAENGLFKCELKNQGSNLSPSNQWQNYAVEMPAELKKGTNNSTIKGEFLIPGPNNEFAVISDIDDTIIVSHSTRLLRKLWLMLFRNSRTRKPFPGVDTFYQALQQGTNGQNTNPFFYVSSSEWNLYDLIDDFCSYNRLPKGVLLLRELEASIFQLRKSGGGNHEHKYEKIRHLFEAYPEMSFILIGDNGQRDPEIYDRITSEFPGRVKAIYIRRVRKRKHAARDREISSELAKMGVPFVLSETSIEAAKHAAELGFISKNSVPKIEIDAQKDRENILTKKVFEKE